LELAATPAGAGFALYSGVISSTPAPETPPLRTGTVPGSIDELPPGRYTVFFRNDGWPEERMEISLAEGETLPVNFAFPHGAVNITSTPAGAEIFLGSRSLGRAPLTVDLPVGKHELSGRYSKRSEKKQTVVVENGSNVTIDFQMRTPSHSSSKRKTKPPESPMKKFGNSLKRVFSNEPPPKHK
jgi:hypothetical protein